MNIFIWRNFIGYFRICKAEVIYWFCPFMDLVALNLGYDFNKHLNVRVTLQIQNYYLGWSCACAGIDISGWGISSLTSRQLISTKLWENHWWCHHVFYFRKKHLLQTEASCWMFFTKWYGLPWDILFCCFCCCSRAIILTKSPVRSESF